MGTRIERRDDGVAILTVEHPPVNALPVDGWFALAEAVRECGADPHTRVIVLRAEGRGFNAGVDIKELAAAEDHSALVAVNHGCFAAFASVYDCPVPVISAVHGFCVGGGIGLVGNSDVIVASDDATFGLPEIDRGALGAATHLARLVPQHLMRTLFYTGKTVTAQQLEHFGSVWRVVAREHLLDTALELAAEIAAKDPLIIRKAKESLNGIDPVDVHHSYRFEQGFTFELNLDGVANRVRNTFGRTEDARAEVHTGPSTNGGRE